MANRKWVVVGKQKPTPPGPKDKIKCVKGGNTQEVMKIVEAKRLTPFHDENLQQCTLELNEILSKYASRSKDPNKELAILDTSAGFFLAWTDSDCVGPEDDEELVLKTLGIE